jgi:hypothetical protein
VFERVYGAVAWQCVTIWLINKTSSGRNCVYLFSNGSTFTDMLTEIINYTGQRTGDLFIFLWYTISTNIDVRHNLRGLQHCHFCNL